MNTSARPIKQKKKWNILVIVLAVVLAALLAAMAFAGNYLFTYALDPTAQVNATAMMGNKMAACRRASR